MSGSSRTTDFWLASACVYLYGEEALLSIADLAHRQCEFLLDVPELDFQEIEAQYRRGELAISDLAAFVSASNRIKGVQCKYRQRGETSWTSPAWISGRG